MQIESSDLRCDGIPDNGAPELDELIGRSPAFIALTQAIPTVARTDVTVLLRGETGTGKELCAQAIHKLSQRAKGPFIVENCGRLPLELIPNEFFGHESGAFTGATHSSKGRIGQARGGTLVFDEVDSLPLQAQSVFLRFLQDKRYQPLGGSHSRDADVRIIAVTNADLELQVETGRFRRDLFHRLKVVELVLPPLRQRPSDLNLLAAYFIKKFAKEFQKPAPDLTPDILSRLHSHDWPGNVRELEDVLLQAVLLCNSRNLLPQDLRLPEPKEPTSQIASMSFNAAKAIVIKNFEMEYLRRIMQVTGGNISVGARIAGLNKGTFWHLLQKHQLLLFPLMAIVT